MAKPSEALCSLLRLFLRPLALCIRQGFILFSCNPTGLKLAGERQARGWGGTLLVKLLFRVEEVFETSVYHQDKYRFLCLEEHVLSWRIELRGYLFPEVVVDVDLIWCRY